MTAPADARVIDRLTKLLGMLGSAHDGERAAAAALADKLLRQHGLTWQDVVKARPANTPWREPADDEERVSIALRYPHVLTDWETNFLRDVNGRTYLSPKQRAVIERITTKVRNHERKA